MHSATAALASLLAFSALITAGFSGMASDRVDCYPVSEMWHDVGADGYSFRAYSNLAARDSDGVECMQWLIRNHRDSTVVKVDWYHGRSSDVRRLIPRGRVAGCYDDTSKCDCDSIPCQVHREASPPLSEPTSADTTVDFGLYLPRPGSQDSPHFRDNGVRARVLPPLSTERARLDSPGVQGASPPAGVPNIFLPPDNWTYPDLILHIGGFPSTADGEVISLDLYFVSSAAGGTENTYLISHDVYSEDGLANYIMTSSHAARVGGLDLEPGTAAIAWTAFEAPHGQNLFDEPFSFFELEELAGRSTPVETTRVGIAEETQITIHYKDEVILETTAPIYVPLTE